MWSKIRIKDKLENSFNFTIILEKIAKFFEEAYTKQEMNVQFVNL